MVNTAQALADLCRKYQDVPLTDIIADTRTWGNDKALTLACRLIAAQVLTGNETGQWVVNWLRQSGQIT